MELQAEFSPAVQVHLDGGEGGIQTYAVSAMVTFGSACFVTLVKSLKIFSLRDRKVVGFNGLAAGAHLSNRAKMVARCSKSSNKPSASGAHKRTRVRTCSILSTNLGSFFQRIPSSRRRFMVVGLSLRVFRSVPSDLILLRRYNQM
jgi:CDGSH-type Zn-finger protein